MTEYKMYRKGDAFAGYIMADNITQARKAARDYLGDDYGKVVAA